MTLDREASKDLYVERQVKAAVYFCPYCRKREAFTQPIDPRIKQPI